MAIRKTKVQRIRDLATAEPNLKAAEIADRLGFSAKYVATQLWVFKKLLQQVGHTPETAIPVTPAPSVSNIFQIGGSHYKDKPIQPWDYIAANRLGYLEGNIVKYVSRYKEKDGIADLHKAKHYLDKLIELTQQQR